MHAHTLTWVWRVILVLHSILYIRGFSWPSLFSWWRVIYSRDHELLFEIWRYDAWAVLLDVGALWPLHLLCLRLDISGTFVMNYRPMSQPSTNVLRLFHVFLNWTDWFLMSLVMLCYLLSWVIFCRLCWDNESRVFSNDSGAGRSTLQHRVPLHFLVHMPLSFLLQEAIRSPLEPVEEVFG